MAKSGSVRVSSAASSCRTTKRAITAITAITDRVVMVVHVATVRVVRRSVSFPSRRKKEEKRKKAAPRTVLTVRYQRSPRRHLQCGRRWPLCLGRCRGAAAMSHIYTCIVWTPASKRSHGPPPCIHEEAKEEEAKEEEEEGKEGKGILQ